MVVVGEASAFAGAFFVYLCYNMIIHHRQRATRLSHSSFLYLLISTIGANIFFRNTLASFR
nr:MAG TPA: hypothetical protein [Caudoviricetes sp.]